jgi:hypothetical protein
VSAYDTGGDLPDGRVMVSLRPGDFVFPATVARSSHIVGGVITGPGESCDDSVPFVASCGRVEYDTGGCFPPGLVTAVNTSSHSVRVHSASQMMRILAQIRTRSDARIKWMHVAYRRRSR